MAVRTVSNTGGSWNATPTWTAGVVPSTTADNVVFTTTSGPLTISATATIENIDFTNYQNTLTLNWPLVVTGPMNFGTHSFTMSFDSTLDSGSLPRGRIIYSDTATITTRSKPWKTPWEFTGTSETTTHIGDLIFDEKLYFDSTTQFTINSPTSSITFNKGFTQLTSAIITGSSSMFLQNGNWENNSSGEMRNNLTIRPTGTVSVVGDVFYGQRTLSYTSSGGGNIVTYGSGTFSDLHINRSSTLDTKDMRWYNVSIPGTMVLTLNSELCVAGTLSVIHSARFTDTGLLNFRDSNNILTGTLTLNPTIAAMTFTFSNNTTVQNALLGGDYNLTLNQNKLSVEGNLIILTSNIDLGETNDRVQGTTKLEMTGTGSLATETLYGWWRNVCRNNIDINTNGTIALAYTGSAVSSYASSSKTYRNFLYGTGTMSYISGTILTATGSLILEDTSWNLVNFGSIKLPEVSFSDWTRFIKPYTKTLSEDIITNTLRFGFDGFNDYRIFPTFNINGGRTLYTKNLYLMGTASGRSKLWFYDNGYVRTTDGQYYDQYADTFVEPPVLASVPPPCQIPEIIVSPTFGATQALISVEKSGFHLMNTALTIGSFSGFTHSTIYGDVSPTTQLARTVWMSGVCTFSMTSPEYPIRMAWGGVGANLVTQRLTLESETYIKDYFAVHFWKWHGTTARLRALNLVNTERLRLENASLQMINGSLIIDHGLTMSNFMFGATNSTFINFMTGFYGFEYNVGTQPLYLTASGYPINITGGVWAQSYYQDFICNDATFSFIGDGTLFMNEEDYNFISDININTIGTYYYRTWFKWGSLSNNRWRTFKHTSGNLLPYNASSYIWFSDIGGYINTPLLTYWRVKFGDAQSYYGFYPSVNSTRWTLQSDINVTDRVTLSGTVGFTMSSFNINNGGDLELMNSGSFDMRGGQSCRNLIISYDDDTGNSIAKIFNGNINVSGSFSISQRNDNGLGRIHGTGAGGTLSTIFLIGTGSYIHTQGNTPCEVNITINTPGTINITGSNTYFQAATFSYVAGTVNVRPTNTLYIDKEATFNTAGITWSRVIFTGADFFNDSVVFKSKFQTSGTISLTYATFSFQGTAGFDTYGLVISDTTAPGYIFFPSNVTYSIRNQFVLPTTSTRTKPHEFWGSGSGTTRTRIIVSSEATQDLPFVEANNIDSSAGAPIWVYKGTFSNTSNWYTLPTQPRTVVWTSSS